MLYLLIGEDDFSLRQFLEGIKKGIGDPTTLDANTAVFNGQQLTLEQLRGACETVPFLAEKRLVIVEGLLARFESRGKAGTPKKARAAASAGQWETLVEYLKRLPDFAVVVLVDGKINARNSLLKAITPFAVVKTFSLLREARLQQWVQQRVSEAGGSITPRAAELLARLVGGNLWCMAGEIEKLVLYCGERRIEEADLAMVVGGVREVTIFALIDAILEFRGTAAARLLQQLLQQGAAPAYILVMLSRQLTTIVRVKELLLQGKSRGEMQDRLGLSSDFVIRKALAQAERYSLERLKEMYHRLLEADVSMKTGRFSGELALSVLLAGLCPQDATGVTG